MDYNEQQFINLEKINVSRGTNATIHRNGLSVNIIIEGISHKFTTAKLAKIFLENYVISSIIEVDRNASGIVSQNTDEAPKKRRGRPKKADNDRTGSI